MNANRVMLALAVLAAIAVAVATTSFSADPKAVNPSEDFALRHPSGVPGMGFDLAAYYRGSDYGQRHPELQAGDVQDFFLRHPGWTTLSPVIDTSDYFLRHPELRVQ